MEKQVSGPIDPLSIRIELALEIASSYGGIDGDHHKMWVIDQMVQALCGGREDYNTWVAEHDDGEDGPHTYEWDHGIAP
jgi:hypothetical protein